MAAAPVLFVPGAARAQTPPHQAGTVTSTQADGMTVSTSGGQQITVKVPQGTKVLVVAPGSRDLSAATSGSLSDIAAGDRVLVTDVPGEKGTPVTAERVILMKSSAIAQSHASEEQAWQQGGGGIVKSVDTAAGTITIVNGARKTLVKTTPSTSFKRYAGGSVLFRDAQASSLGAVQAGDQLRVRGAKSADESEITADAVVTGRFMHYAGLISSIDAAAHTVTLKDLATKHNVTVAIEPNTNLRRLPERAAMMFAMAEKGHGAGEPSQGRAEGGMAARRPELSQILPRLPEQSLADLKPGEAVMIVATAPSPETHQASAITLLAGVEPLLTAGQAPELSPWSMGGDAAPDESGGPPANR